ncbi:hypothetical protein FB567DRAFT_520856 [Paraphoma chrysanthemicola]|uniref:BTB domain-containing protein n=1 Tax=Paraphoma chrysanthemicola TaxID=798071 RepID=A0A8K0R9H8_9PLEO|nr:hypothetical protein FB567DRAFT_520856 [Paraphoma chrysanthemicola]
MVDIYVGTENTHWILHEKLLCHYSPFFRRIFYAKNSNTTSFGLPEEEDAPFKTFVGWLYSSSLPVPREESDLGLLFDLYLMAEKFQIPNLVADVLQVVREWYKYSDSYPGLRRVQYVYANTEEGSPMRHMLVHTVARMMVIEKGIPAHWDKALRKNGQLAVDIIKAIQDWRLDEEVVPDARDEPEDAEELIDVEAETEKLDKEAEEDIEAGVVPEQEEEEGEAEEADHEDDSEATVVDSPTSAKRNEESEKKANKASSDIKGKANDMSKDLPKDLSKDFKKFSLQEVPNGLAGADYGTLRA